MTRAKQEHDDEYETFQMENDYEALVEWSEDHGLEPHHMLALFSVTLGRVIAGLIQEKGLSLEEAQKLAQDAQWGLIRGAGLDGDDADGTRH